MGEGFSNPVVNASGELIKDNIHSQNFVTGVSGWDIERDGTAEFNDVTVRGTIVEGPTTGAHIEIGPKLPPSPPGPGDEIRIYNGTPVEVIHIDPNGITAANDLTNLGTANYVRLNVTDAVSSNPALEIQPGVTAGPQLWLPTIQHTVAEIAGSTQRQNLEILAPIPSGGNYNTDAGRIRVQGESNDATLPPSVLLAGDNTAQYDTGITHPSVLLQSLPVGSRAAIRLLHNNASNTGNRALSALREADPTHPGWFVDFDGHMQWAGAGLNADTQMYRESTAGGALVADTMYWDNASSAEVWHLLSFLNSFSNRGAGFCPFAYRRVVSPPNDIEIKGQVVSGATVASGTIIANLPVGYRPISEQTFIIQNNTTGVTSLLAVETNGDIKIFAPANWTAGAVFQINGTVALDL